jgi:cysteinyl-tRNA synthetase
LIFNIHVGNDAVQKLNPTMEIQMRRERKEKTIASGLCHRLGGLSAVVDAHFRERKERQKCVKQKLRARISERERRNFERKNHLRGKKRRKSQQIEDKKTCLQMNS